MTGRSDSHRVFWIFLAAAAAATLAFFASFVFHPGSMIFGTDMVSQAYQSRAFAVQEVHAGHGLPQWNPFVFAGLPYLSALPYPVYYPTSLLYFVLPLHRAIGWAFVLHFLLAGVLAYALARELRLDRGPAVVMGAAYMFTGYIVSHLYAGQDGRMFAMQWTPALFLLAERAISRRRVHWFGWLALVVALQLFTPHVQMTYFAAMAVTAYVAFRLVGTWREERCWKTVLGLAAGFVGAYALAGLLALVEIWPTMNMLGFSHRAARGYAYASSWSMPVQETLAAVWPDFQGTLQSYWGTNPFKLHTEYLGAVPVLLAVLALVARRTGRAWFFAGLGLVALLFAWGGATPVHRLFYWTLPVLKSFRAPGMMYSVVALSVVVLAGHGAQALVDRRESLAEAGHPAWKVLGGLAVLWAVLWFWAAGSPAAFGRTWAGLLYGSLSADQAQKMAAAMPVFARSFGLFAVFWAAGVALCWAAARERLRPLLACALLAILATLDLWSVDRRFYETFPAERLTTRTPTVRTLQSQPTPFRVLPTPDAFGPNDLMLFRIPAVTGSQNFRLAWWDDLVGDSMQRLTDTRLWALLDVKYLATTRPLDVTGLTPVETGGPLRLYRWEGPARGAWVVHRTATLRAGEDPADAIGRIDPTDTALLEPGTPTPPLAAGDPGRVRWDERFPDRISLDVETDAPGLLVLSEIYHPYWSATVDGHPADLLRVDVALRGLAVAAGRHRVVMTFRDPNVARGAWGSLAGVALLAAFLALTWKRREAAGEEGA